MRLVAWSNVRISSKIFRHIYSEVAVEARSGLTSWTDQTMMEGQSDVECT